MNSHIPPTIKHSDSSNSNATSNSRDPVVSSNYQITNNDIDMKQQNNGRRRGLKTISSLITSGLKGRSRHAMRAHPLAVARRRFYAYETFINLPSGSPGSAHYSTDLNITSPLSSTSSTSSSSSLASPDYYDPLLSMGSSSDTNFNPYSMLEDRQTRLAHRLIEGRRRRSSGDSSVISNPNSLISVDSMDSEGRIYEIPFGSSDNDNDNDEFQIETYAGCQGESVTVILNDLDSDNEEVMTPSDQNDNRVSFSRFVKVEYTYGRKEYDRSPIVPTLMSIEDMKQYRQELRLLRERNKTLQKRHYRLRDRQKFRRNLVSQFGQGRKFSLVTGISRLQMY